MPTVGILPSLQSTQLVGAVLLHQFARERFIEARVPEEIRENLDCMVANTIEESHVIATENSNDNNANNISQTSEISTTLVNDSHNSAEITLNSTNNQSVQNNLSQSSEPYHSLTESMNCNDNTVYHSINAGRTSVNLGKLQSSPAMAYYGRQLRLLAEEFERDRKRLAVKDHANKVELNDISKENFIKLLEELFRDRITREKIVVLFFFCTDVALRAASFAQELVVKLMGWSFSYIINTVCRVVHELGGWDNLLFRRLPSLLITCCAALGICALAMYLRNSLRATIIT